MKSFQKKSTRYLLSALLAFAILVAPHEGEFWPFSIYPMFSKAGKTWNRAIVRDMSSVPDSLHWETTDLYNLPGSPVSLQKYGVDQIDYANYVSKTKNWTWERQLAFQQMFGKENIKDKRLMVIKVSGWFENKDSITTQAIPLFLVTADTVYSNPGLLASSNHSQGNDE